MRTALEIIPKEERVPRFLQYGEFHPPQNAKLMAHELYVLFGNARERENFFGNRLGFMNFTLKTNRKISTYF